MRPNCAQDLLADLSRFVAGAWSCRGGGGQGGLGGAELTRTALSLLHSLPAARDAMLEYLGWVYDEAVGLHTSTRADRPPPPLMGGGGGGCGALGGGPGSN